ncbi:MAG: hypothetical protein GDA43_15405 [Hormoscilla sp. SP5CHS1]|nr:hypothetical protein [Hormoscilla sp. SP12CHS1]MBC6454409.1 hypothetical protein [Hormoscilla sp. SP5CHS1]
MHPKLEAIFNEAESRYLKPEELKIISQYVESLPSRLETYQQLRDKELEIMQAVASQLETQLPQAKTSELERSLKNAMLMLRYCGIAMLLNDESFVKERLRGWLDVIVETYNSSEIETKLYRLLWQQLSQVMSKEQLGLLKPSLTMAKEILINK